MLQLLLSPRFSELLDDAGDGSSGGNGPVSVEDTISLFNQDDNESENEDDSTDLLGDDKPEGEESKEDDKGKKKGDEEEIELEEEPENLDELITPVKRKAILAKYPNIFKDFPYLEKAYYREQKFTEIFPTLEDANKAQETSKEFEQFSDALLSGNAESVLKSVRDANEDSFKTLVDNYLPSLQKVDNGAYLHIISNVVKSAVASAWQAGKSNNNEDLVASAENLYRYVFGTGKFEAPTNYGKGPAADNDESKKISEERAQLQQERFNSAFESINTSADNAVKSTIAQHIDPKGVMSPYVKNKAIDDAMAQVDKIMSADSRFKALNDKLWAKASENGFDKSSLSAIKSNYLSRVKTVLRDVIRNTRNEALKGTGRRAEIDEESAPVKRGGNAGPNRSSNSSGNNKQPGRGMKTIDFLNQD